MKLTSEDIDRMESAAPHLIEASSPTNPPPPPCLILTLGH